VQCIGEVRSASEGACLTGRRADVKEERERESYCNGLFHKWFNIERAAWNFLSVHAVLVKT